MNDPIFWAQIRWGSWKWDSRDGLQRLRPHRSKDGKLNWIQWDRVFFKSNAKGQP